MTCEEFENQFLSGPETPLPAATRAAREKHLASCAACRSLTRQLQQLDATLMRAIKTPVLTADFDLRLAGKIKAEGKVLTAAEQAERKRQLQAEYEAGLQKVRKSFLQQVSVHEGTNYLLGAALAGFLAWIFMPELIHFVMAQGFSPANQTALLGGLTGLVFLAIGFAVAFPRQLRQL
jgi:anti-sigma factor RsiW